MEISSLPVGGMITRIACGSTIRRMICCRRMPSAAAASVWPSLTDRMPARTISAMYAASFSDSPITAATKNVTPRRPERANSGPNGIPSPNVGKSTLIRPQNTSWV